MNASFHSVLQIQQSINAFARQLTPYGPGGLVAAASPAAAIAGVVVLRVRPRRGACEGEAGRAGHLRGGRPAVAALAVAAHPIQGPFGQLAAQTATMKVNRYH